MRFGFHKQSEYLTRYRHFQIGPFGHVGFHLHVQPNEKTENGAFAVHSSVSITARFLGRDFNWTDVLHDTEYWGLCVRDKYAHLFERSAKREP